MLNSFITAIKGSQIILAITHFFISNDVSVARKEAIARSAVIFDASEHAQLMKRGIALTI